ncbi:MAG: hypothetical protein H7X95_12345 [Deltaproteobacteria bacterium]|nr:hypothetical protein [Deltaproteobacteria bacterium]
MKRVDPTVKIGVVLHWPYNEYADWNGQVLPQACAAADFGINHWYAGSTVASLLTIARTDIPNMFRDLRLQLTMASNNCGTKGATMPIAVTEWGAQYYPDLSPIDRAFNPRPPATMRTQTQVGGIFAALSYAHFMEQGALAVHWLELHSATYLGETDTPAWGYHGQQMAHYLAEGGDTMVRATVSNAGTLMTSLQTHAAIHKVGGGVSVMLTNTSPTIDANVTVNLTGGTTTFACVGTRHAYLPLPPDLDGTVTSAPIFAPPGGTSVTVSVPAYSVIVVSFPKG